jgi:hypothetical protein
MADPRIKRVSPASSLKSWSLALSWWMRERFELVLFRARD